MIRKQDEASLAFGILWNPLAVLARHWGPASRQVWEQPRFEIDRRAVSFIRFISMISMRSMMIYATIALGTSHLYHYQPISVYWTNHPPINDIQWLLCLSQENHPSYRRLLSWGATEGIPKSHQAVVAFFKTLSRVYQIKTACLWCNSNRFWSSEAWPMT